MTPEHWQLISRLYHDALAPRASSTRQPSPSQLFK